MPAIPPPLNPEREIDLRNFEPAAYLADVLGGDSDPITQGISDRIASVIDGIRTDLLGEIDRLRAELSLTPMVPGELPALVFHSASGTATRVDLSPLPSPRDHALMQALAHEATRVQSEADIDRLAKRLAGLFG